MEGHSGVSGHVSYIHADADLPPVAVIDRPPIRTRHKIIFGVIALLGAVAWAVIAFARGETVNAVWFVIAAICTYVIGYRFYARLIERKIVQPRDDHATPAEIFENGTDYVPTDMLSDGLGNLGAPLAKLRNPSWRPGAWGCSLAVVAAWGSMLLSGVTDPLGGINSLFPLFGIANQLLAGIALTVITVVVIKKGLLKWAWIPGIPLLWVLTVTLTASWQKIFSPDPNVGYWTQHFRYAAAKASGKTAFGSAKTPGQITDVIRNTFVQGTLSVTFASAVIIVLVAAITSVFKTIRGDGLPLTEDDPVPSKDVRTLRHDPHCGGTGGAKTMGRAALDAVGVIWLRRIARGISWYWGTVMGDTHYRRYLDYRRRTHPGEPVLSERDYWRERYRAERGARCC